MIMELLIIGLLIVAESSLIIVLFDSIRNVALKKKSSKIMVEDPEFGKKITLDISEIILLITLNVLIMYYIAKELMSETVMVGLIILVLVILVTIWSLLRFQWARGIFEYHGIEVNLSPTYPPIKNNYTTRKVEAPKKTNKIKFSRYHGKNNRINYAFDSLHPDYNSLNKNSRDIDTTKDYSAYNGYPKDHICHGCGCMRRENGYVFCGKMVPGMGAVGCSERWGCLNCKSCKQGKNTRNTKKDYTCDNCKCHKTITGTICGKKDRTNGYVHKCNSECDKCDKCYGADSDDYFNDRGAITVDPISNLKNVIINNINSRNINNLV